MTLYVKQTWTDGVSALSAARMNYIEAGILDSGTWQTWSPAWTSTGTAPAVGNGSFIARYVQVGKLVVFVFQFSPGSSSTFGTGDYRFTLPVAASASVLNLPFGTAVLYDNSGPMAFTQAFPASATTFAMTYPATWPTGTEVHVGQLAPWTWAVNDLIRVVGCYEAA